MTAMWIGLWWVSLALAAVLGWAMGAAVTRGAARTVPAPDYRVGAGEACRGGHGPSEADMLRVLAPTQPKQRG